MAKQKRSKKRASGAESGTPEQPTGSQPAEAAPAQAAPAEGASAEAAPAAAAPASAAPEQKLGDTPVAPWQMPTAEQKAEAKPVRSALRDALDAVDSPEKAEAVIAELKEETAGKTLADVAAEQPTPASTAQAAQQVAAANAAAPTATTTKQVLAETARVVATAKPAEREAVAQAAQEVFNAEQQGAEPLAPEQRDYLRQAVLHQLKPLDALDAELFLKVNHLPHTRESNRFFYFFTFVFTGGMAWFALMGVVTLVRRRVGWKMLREAALPLAVATFAVEYPIKWLFQRKRPFISIIQAIVIGKKPGTWSFPSGHSAAAFGGAWLFSRYLPRLSALWYGLASIVAFSRIYLGDHYPGDVTSGSLLGVMLVMVLRRLPWPWLRKAEPRSPWARLSALRRKK